MRSSAAANGGGNGSVDGGVNGYIGEHGNGYIGGGRSSGGGGEPTSSGVSKRTTHSISAAATEDKKRTKVACPVQVRVKNAQRASRSVYRLYEMRPRWSGRVSE